MIIPNITPKKVNWIKIEGHVFEIDQGEVQFSVGTHATINIKLDINQNPGYYSFFIKKYEEAKKFDIVHQNFLAIGTHIKSMDFLLNQKMNLGLICDKLDEVDTQVRRDEIISDLLNDKTLPNENNIN